MSHQRPTASLLKHGATLAAQMLACLAVVAGSGCASRVWNGPIGDKPPSSRYEFRNHLPPNSGKPSSSWRSPEAPAPHSNVLVVVANAEAQAMPDWSNRGREPRLIETLKSSFDASLGLLNTETVGLARQGFLLWGDHVNAQRPPGSPASNGFSDPWPHSHGSFSTNQDQHHE